MHDQLLIKRSAVDAYAHRLAVVAGNAADRGELFVTALAGANVAGIDAIFIESSGAVGIFGQQNMAVIVKIADERRFAAGVEHALLDFGNSGSGFGDVYRDAHHFRTGGGKLEALLHGGSDIGGVGIGHRLDDDRSASTDGHAADFDSMSLVSMGHERSAPGFD